MKEFEAGGQELVLTDITSEIRTEGQKRYSQVFNKAWGEGIPLRIEIERKLREKGLLDDNTAEEAIRAELRESEVVLRSAKRSDGTRLTREDGRQLALAMRRLREKLSNVSNDVSDLFSRTAESIASNEQFQYFIYACTRRKDGRRYWDSVESFMNDNSPVATQAVRAFVANMANVDVNYEMSLPENVWLKRFGYLKDDGTLLNPDGKMINNDDQLVNEKGHIVNADGLLIDDYGNVIDEKGNLVVEDGWAE